MLTAERARYLFNYDPNTGIFTWKNCKHKYRNGTRACGSVASHGYPQIYAGTVYLAHRVAWLYMTGHWPDSTIDHANGIRTDNRWSNLRLATQTQQNANMATRADNKSGFKGVSRNRGNKKWRARIAVEGKQLLIGVFDCPVTAHAAYVRAASELYGTFARAQ